ncbi:MAG: tetrahydromethanopterin S-methyltransferase subunit H [Desulfurococcaceae archaeon]
MFKFKKQPKILELKGVRIGGFPANPPVMIGTIFYHGHKLVQDSKEGLFDKSLAESLIISQEELSDKTGIPGLIDVASDSPKAIVKYMDFVANLTSKPFLVDAVSRDVMEAAVNYASEVGLMDRIIINSINPKTSDEELSFLRERGARYAVLLLYTHKIIDVKERLKIASEMLPKLASIGIDTPLVDTFVIDIPSLSISLRTMIHIKNEYGLPVGSGAHNAVSSMKKHFKQKYSKEGVDAMEITSDISPLLMGGDFVLYGPIELHKYMLPSAYLVYTSYRYLYRNQENLLNL